MFKELQSVVGDSSAFTMCLAFYVQVPPAPTSLPIFGCEVSEASCSPQFDPCVLEREDLLDIFLFFATRSLADSSVSVRVR
jgi:hypothetical protein